MGPWLLFLGWMADVPCCWNVVFVNGAGGSVTLTGLRISGLLRMLGSVSCVEKSPSPGWNSGVVFGYLQKCLSSLFCVKFVGGSITTFRDSGRLETDCLATDSAHPAVLSWLRLDPTLSSHLPLIQVPLSFLWSAPVSDVFVPRLPLLSFVFKGSLMLSKTQFVFLMYCIFRRNSCSCCCNSCSRWCCSCCKRNFSCWRRSSISSRSCSNSNCRSHSRCSVSFWALRFSSSNSSICRLLDDRKLAILGCFLLPCVAECLQLTWTFSSAFSIAQFSVSVTVSFGSLSAADVDETNDVWFPPSAVSWYCFRFSNNFYACLNFSSNPWQILTSQCIIAAWLESNFVTSCSSLLQSLLAGVV